MSKVLISLSQYGFEPAVKAAAYLDTLYPRKRE